MHTIFHPIPPIFLILTLSSFQTLSFLTQTSSGPRPFLPLPTWFPAAHTPASHHPINPSIYTCLLTCPSPLPGDLLCSQLRAPALLPVCQLVCVFCLLPLEFLASLTAYLLPNLFCLFDQVNCLSSYLPCLHSAFEFSPLYQDCYNSWFLCVLSISQCGDVLLSCRGVNVTQHVILCCCIHQLHQSTCHMSSLSVLESSRCELWRYIILTCAES